MIKIPRYFGQEIDGMDKLQLVALPGLIVAGDDSRS